MPRQSKAEVYSDDASSEIINITDSESERSSKATTKGSKSKATKGKEKSKRPNKTDDDDNKELMSASEEPEQAKKKTKKGKGKAKKKSKKKDEDDDEDGESGSEKDKDDPINGNTLWNLPGVVPWYKKSKPTHSVINEYEIVMPYQCGDCANYVQIHQSFRGGSMGERHRCNYCGCRILMKLRTSNKCQFEAR